MALAPRGEDVADGLILFVDVISSVEREGSEVMKAPHLFFFGAAH